MTCNQFYINLKSNKNVLKAENPKINVCKHKLMRNLRLNKNLLDFCSGLI